MSPTGTGWEPAGGDDIEDVEVGLVAEDAEIGAAVEVEVELVAEGVEIGVAVALDGAGEDMPVVEVGLEGEIDLEDAEVELGDPQVLKVPFASLESTSAIWTNVRWGCMKSAKVALLGALLAAEWRLCTGVKPSSVSRAKLAVSALPSIRLAPCALFGHLLC